MIAGSIFTFLSGAALFVFPGWWWHRRHPTALQGVTPLALSVALWFLLLQAFLLAGISLHRWTALGGWILVCAVVVAATRLRPPVLQVRSSVSGWTRPEGADWVWAAAASLGFVSIAARALIDPLSGWDTSFRWNGLATFWLAQGNLDGYPPLTDADFVRYPWVDGIPPLVPSLNVLLYLLAGSTDPAWTAARVIVEALATGGAIALLAQRLWGPRAVWPALGIAGSSALLLWGIAMGQETGLLAVTVTGMAALIAADPAKVTRRDLLGAGVLAGLAASTREYACSVPVAGLVILYARGVRAPRQLWAFAVPAIVIAAPWYLRNTWLTGNPFYPLSPGGVLPTNEAFASALETFALLRSWSAPLTRGDVVARVILVTAGLVVVLGCAGLVAVHRRRAWWVVSLVAMLGGLWAWSVSQTAGGYLYSMRVLTPAIALLAALGGWIGPPAPRRVRLILAGLTLLVAVDGARRSWFMPTMASTPVWPITFDRWSKMNRMLASVNEDSGWDEIAARTTGRIVATDNLLIWLMLRDRQQPATLLFSPASAGVFRADASPVECRRRWLEAGIGWLALTLDSPDTRLSIERYEVLGQIVQTQQPALIFGPIYLYDLQRLTPPFTDD